MKSTALKSLLGGVALLAAPMALAGSTTSIPAFDAKLAAARTSTSPGGTTVLRQEIAGALRSFTADDGKVDAAERQYLNTVQSNASFQPSLTSQGWAYYYYFQELNDALTTPASMTCYPIDPQESYDGPFPGVYGALGGLTPKSGICEGYLPAGTVANQVTLQTLYFYNFDSTNVQVFEPINVRELINKLTPLTSSVDELDGAVAFITELTRTSDRLYVSSWRNDYGRQYPGGLGGIVVAAVGNDRRSVRFVELLTWSE